MYRYSRIIMNSIYWWEFTMTRWNLISPRCKEEGSDILTEWEFRQKSVNLHAFDHTGSHERLRRTKAFAEHHEKTRYEIGLLRWENYEVPSPVERSTVTNTQWARYPSEITNKIAPLGLVTKLLRPSCAILVCHSAGSRQLYRIRKPPR